MARDGECAREVVQTSTLIGLPLDWAVAQCQGINVVAWHAADREAYFNVLEEAFLDKEPTTFYSDPEDTFYPTVHYEQGGPILSEARISRTIDHSGLWTAYWTEGLVEGDAGKLWKQCDKDELIAGLRCYVALNMGAEIDVPDELMPQAA